jgi:hypothetical protein
VNYGNHALRSSANTMRARLTIGAYRCGEAFETCLTRGRWENCPSDHVSRVVLLWQLIGAQESRAASKSVQRKLEYP